MDGWTTRASPGKLCGDDQQHHAGNADGAGAFETVCGQHAGVISAGNRPPPQDCGSEAHFMDKTRPQRTYNNRHQLLKR